MTIFHPARESDLEQVYDVYYENEIRGLAEPPARGDIPAVIRYTLRTGTMYVAELDGQVQAFATAITRGQVTFLTDMFVRPASQSSQLGKTLLDCVLPQDDLIHCTMSSTDPRAQALYIRAGMQPQWPNFCLRLDGPPRLALPTSDVAVIEGRPGDPAFVQWDAEISGRLRPQDHTFWQSEQRAAPLWFERRGESIGYGYVRLGAVEGHAPVCKLGPIGVRTAQDATACVLASVNWATQHAPALLINVPGPHPCLSSVLAQGFRIIYVELFHSSAHAPFFDPHCYISSGSTLL